MSEYEIYPGSTGIPRPLTPEEARDVELSRNPIKRLGQLAEYGAAFHQTKIGWSPLPLFMTRGDLVRFAEARQHAEEIMNILAELPREDS